MRHSIETAADLIRFQAAWFGCILLAHPLDIAAATLLLAAHLAYWHRRSEWQWAMLCAFTGLLVDSLWGAVGVLSFPAQSFPPGIAPLWLVLLWAHFGTALRHSMARLGEFPLLAGALGAIFGPLSYYAGAELTDKAALGFGPIWSLATLSLTWLIIFPALLHLAKRLDTDAPSN